MHIENLLWLLNDCINSLEAYRSIISCSMQAIPLQLKYFWWLKTKLPMLNTQTLLWCCCNLLSQVWLCYIHWLHHLKIALYRKENVHRHVLRLILHLHHKVAPAKLESLQKALEPTKQVRRVTKGKVIADEVNCIPWSCFLEPVFCFDNSFQSVWNTA